MDRLNQSEVSALPRIRVLLATYNGERWLEDQIRSVLRQRGVEVQIEISDDLSTDGTPDLIHQIAEADNRVIVAEMAKKHGSASNNFFSLLREADFSQDDYVALCDQDDIWSDDKLSRAVSCLLSSDAVGYSAAVTAFWPNGATKVLRQSNEVTYFDYLFEGAGQGCTYVLRAQFAERVQRYLKEHPALFESIHYHDWAIYAIARTLGEKWYFDERSVLSYRQHGLNDTGARGSFRSNLKRLFLIRSGWYGNQIDAIGRLCLGVDLGQGSHPHLPARNHNRTKGVVSRLRYSAFVAKNSRRRFGDRIIVSIAVLFGWL